MRHPIPFASIALLSTAACAPGDGDVPGSAALAITSIPTGVGCLRVIYRAPGATVDTTRNFGVTPGASAALDLGPLTPRRAR
jgi:hypothetical protein